MKDPLIITDEYQYLEMLSTILRDGESCSDRTGTGTLRLFHYEMSFDISNQFPLLTTKKVHFPSIAHELIWFLSGQTNIKYLQDNNVKIWNEWADKDGNLGPVYGHQWRKWQHGEQEIDQLSNLINQIKCNPFSRRHILSAWNVGAIDKMALPPCHLLAQFYVSTKKQLHCKLYQRSADVFLGVPFNIASYSLLTYMIAQQCDLTPGRFIHSLGDAHIYQNHIEAVKLQLQRTPRAFPTLTISPKENLYTYQISDFVINNYNPHPRISAPISI